MFDEKMDLLQYMIENGFDMGEMTMDEMLARPDLPQLYAEFFGEE